MLLRSLLIPFSNHEEEIPALETAFMFAAQTKAHLQVVYTEKNFSEALCTPVEAPLYISTSVIESLTEQEQCAWSRTQVRFHDLRLQWGLGEDHTTATASLHKITGALDEAILPAAYCSDVTFFSQNRYRTALDYSKALHAVLFHSGHPILVAPSAPVPALLPRNIMIAWNSSAEATHAVFSSLPLLQQAENISIVTIDPKEHHAPPEALKNYLGHHGIHQASCYSFTPTTSDMGPLLLQSAQYYKVDLLVMGGFSHFRLQELLLGGVSHYMLMHSQIPLWIAH